MDALDKIYQSHHESGNRYDHSLFRDTRGDFLRQRIGSGKSVLDIGCRDGTLTSTYCEGNDVIGVDIDSDALDTAKRTLGIRTMQFNLTDDWPLEDSTFDRIVAGEVLEHLYFPEKVITRIARVLKPDGVLLGSVPNAFSLANRVRLFLGNKRDTPLADPTHINHFSRRELQAMLLRYFEVVSIYPLGRFQALDRVAPGMFCFMLLFEACHPRR
jgi:2-polyprenyl-3-methyl-5-hydroxy-6-metoxy-1,4-benzoquinol methylase